MESRWVADDGVCMLSRVAWQTLKRHSSGVHCIVAVPYIRIQGRPVEGERREVHTSARPGIANEDRVVVVVGGSGARGQRVWIVLPSLQKPPAGLRVNDWRSGVGG